MGTCEELTRRIASDELRSASPWVRLRAWIHLAMCRRCRRYEQQIRAIGAGARRTLNLGAEDREVLERLESKILERCFRDPEDPPSA